MRCSEQFRNKENLRHEKRHKGNAIFCAARHLFEVIKPRVVVFVISEEGIGKRDY